MSFFHKYDGGDSVEFRGLRHLGVLELTCSDEDVGAPSITVVLPLEDTTLTSAPRTRAIVGRRFFAVRGWDPEEARSSSTVVEKRSALVRRRWTTSGIQPDPKIRGMVPATATHPKEPNSLPMINQRPSAGQGCGYEIGPGIRVKRRGCPSPAPQNRQTDALSEDHRMLQLLKSDPAASIGAALSECLPEGPSGLDPTCNELDFPHQESLAGSHDLALGKRSESIYDLVNSSKQRTQSCTRICEFNRLSSRGCVMWPRIGKEADERSKPVVSPLAC